MMKQNLIVTFIPACAILLNPVYASAEPMEKEQAAVEVQATSGIYKSDSTHTSLSWSIDHFGLSSYKARFNSVVITLTFNAEDLSQSSVLAEIDPMSVDTGYPLENVDFDKKISTSEDILNAANFPKIQFVSTKLIQTGPETAELVGDLTLLGVTKSVTLDVEYYGSIAQHPFASVPAIGFTASGSIDRTDFGMSFLSGKGLGDIVNFEIRSEFIKDSELSLGK